MGNKNKHRLQMQWRKPEYDRPLPPEKVAEYTPNQRLNQYTCRTCGKTITTVDRDEGTTPMMLACRATQGCDGSMFSAMYRVDPNLTPDWEWYKPAKLPKGDMREYVEMGGLLLREIEK